VAATFTFPRSFASLSGEEVHRHHHELERGPAAEEDHLEVVAEAEELLEERLRLVVHLLEVGGSVAHLEDRHPRAREVEELGLDLLEDREGQAGGTRVEVHRALHGSPLRPRPRRGRQLLLSYRFWPA
jgi:hypothetical protein